MTKQMSDLDQFKTKPEKLLSDIMADMADVAIAINGALNKLDKCTTRIAILKRKISNDTEN